MCSAALECHIIVPRTITITISVSCTISVKSWGEDTKNSPCDRFSGEIQRPARGERSASRREEVCREWASISSFFLLFLGVKRMCSLASGTTTSTVVGLRHGKHSSEKTPIAMWTRTKPPTLGRKSFCRCIHGGSEAPTSPEKKAPLCLWNPIWHSGR